MKTASYIILFFLVSCRINAQNAAKDTIDIILVNPEIPAEFPGGNSAFMKYIRQHINTISFTEEEAGNLRRAVARFTISETGTVQDVRLLKSSGVIRIDTLLIKSLEKMPEWKPATTNGKTVKQQWNLPLNICLK